MNASTANSSYVGLAHNLPKSTAVGNNGELILNWDAVEMHSYPSMQERLTLASAHTDKPLLSRQPIHCMSRAERLMRPVTSRLSVAYYDRRNSKKLQSALRNFLSWRSTPPGDLFAMVCVCLTGMSRGSCQLLTLSYPCQGCMFHVGIALERQRDSCTTVPYPSVTLASCYPTGLPGI